MGIGRGIKMKHEKYEVNKLGKLESHVEIKDLSITSTPHLGGEPTKYLIRIIKHTKIKNGSRLSRGVETCWIGGKRKINEHKVEGFVTREEAEEHIERMEWEEIKVW